ncbi:thiamine phosphate synthase [Salibacterium sp. K-3]
MLHIISTGRQPFRQWLDITTRIYRETDYIHIREKTWDAAQIRLAVQKLEEEGVPRTRIILNDHPELVKEMELAAVHLPEPRPIPDHVTFPGKKGSSIHDAEAAVQKEREGADYLFFGHVFETGSKPNDPGRGLNALKQTAAAVSIPVIAIGGITPDNAGWCLDYGATGAAVMSGVYEAHDPKAAAEAFRAVLPKGGIA